MTSVSTSSAGSCPASASTASPAVRPIAWWWAVIARNAIRPRRSLPGSGQSCHHLDPHVFACAFSCSNILSVFPASLKTCRKVGWGGTPSGSRSPACCGIADAPPWPTAAERLVCNSVGGDRGTPVSSPSYSPDDDRSALSDHHGARPGRARLGRGYSGSRGGPGHGDRRHSRGGGRRR